MSDSEDYSDHDELPLESPYPNEDYTIAWIYALEVELDAARLMLDKEHSLRPQWTAAHDNNTYTLGELHGHFIVIVGLPRGVKGNIATSNVVNGIVQSFTKLQFALLVGIGGGIPGPQLENPDPDVRLGDVVVGVQQGTNAGVTQHDQGHYTANKGFIQGGSFHPAHDTPLKATQTIASNRKTLRLWDLVIKRKLKYAGEDVRKRFTRPDAKEFADILKGQRCTAPKSGQEGFVCFKKGCTSSALDIKREERPDKNPRIHFGTISSGASVIEDAARREEIRIATEARDISLKTKACCVDMEAAGMASQGLLKYMIIRGISDYCDSQKNKIWHPYAAIAAAAYASVLLSAISPKGPRPQPQLPQQQELACSTPKTNQTSTNVPSTTGTHTKLVPANPRTSNLARDNGSSASVEEVPKTHSEQATVSNDTVKTDDEIATTDLKRLGVHRNPGHQSTTNNLVNEPPPPYSDRGSNSHLAIVKDKKARAGHPNHELELTQQLTAV